MRVGASRRPGARRRADSDVRAACCGDPHAKTSATINDLKHSWGDAMNRLVAIFLLLLYLPIAGARVDVEAPRVWTAPAQTRVVVDAGGPISHSIIPLTDPERLVVDIPEARLNGKLPKVDAKDPSLIRLRAGSPDGESLRFVFDLKQPVRVKSFLLPPNERYGHRLVIDLSPKPGQQALLAGTGTGMGRQRNGPGQTPLGRGGVGVPEVIIAIDAGHGGEDPGAIGPSGTLEKDVTLAIAERLAALIERAPHMRPIMIRDGDYYVGLRERVTRARQQQADLFLSIHADAYRDAQICGSSVYTLSVNGASSEAAKWLADRENNADRIGGIPLRDVDDDLNRVLFDLAQSGSLEHSRYAAEQLLTKLGRVGPLHQPDVQHARFVVLKSPDVPSVLIETAFISNPRDEERLTDSDYQQRLAQAIFEGVEGYFAMHRLPATAPQIADAGAGRSHVIYPGDTLIAIARRYDVSLNSLRVANSLDSDLIRVGEILRIPEG